MTTFFELGLDLESVAGRGHEPAVIIALGVVVAGLASRVVTRRISDATNRYYARKMMRGDTIGSVRCAGANRSAPQGPADPKGPRGLEEEGIEVAYPPPTRSSTSRWRAELRAHQPGSSSAA